jgi:hypothetical protein
MRTVLSWGLVFAFVLFSSPYLLRSQATGKGQLLGFLFDRDGSTPIAGAVVVAKNVTTGTVFESSKTDALGVFRFEALEAGIYALGVTFGQGSYNSLDLVGIRPNETAKISIALEPYGRDTLEAAQAVAREEKERGESRVGRIVRYIPETKEALVAIDRGLLQVGDRMRVRGRVTDFSQDLKSLKVQGGMVKRVLTGQEALLPVARPCAEGDGVYVVCKRGVPPLFLAPLGLAAIVGGASLVTIVEEEPVSPDRPTRIKD